MMLRTNGEALSFSQRSGLLAKMSLLFQHSMSLARFSTVAALLSCALPSRATPTYSYGISENVPCITGCGRFLALDGTIDVDALGTLSESNFVRWDLLIQFPGVKFLCSSTRATVRFECLAQPKSRRMRSI